MKCLYSAVSVMALFGLMACGGSDPAANPVSAEQHGLKRSWLNGKDGVPPAIDLDSVYRTGCVSDKLDGHSVFSESSLRLYSSRQVPVGNTGGTVPVMGYYLAVASSYFVDSLCTQPLFSATGEGTYELNPQRTEIAASLEIESTTLRNAKLVENFNTAKICGFSDWAAGTTKAIQGTSCATQRMKLGLNSLDANDERIEIKDLKDPSGPTQVFQKISD